MDNEDDFKNVKRRMQMNIIEMVTLREACIKEGFKPWNQSMTWWPCRKYNRNFQEKSKHDKLPIGKELKTMLKRNLDMFETYLNLNGVTPSHWSTRYIQEPAMKLVAMREGKCWICWKKIWIDIITSWTNPLI